MILFAAIKPYFTDPLIWFGIVLILMLLLIRYFLNKNIIKQPPDWLASDRSRVIIKHGYLLGVLVTVLGFGLQHNELGEAEQELAKRLINTEVKSNLASIKFISQNTEKLIDSQQNLFEALRHTDSEIMQYLFPAKEPISGKNKQLSQKIETAFNALKESNLLKNKSAMNAFNSSKKTIKTIVSPIENNLNLMHSLGSDEAIIETQHWHIHKNVISKLDGFDTAQFEQSLTKMQAIKTEYNQGLKDSKDYIDEVLNFLEPSAFIGNGPVFQIITKEKKSLDSLITLNNKIKAALPELQRMHLD